MSRKVDSNKDKSFVPLPQYGTALEDISNIHKNNFNRIFYMKPKKNQFFCPACSKPKMLFESQAKADNFIKFNKNNFKSPYRVPVRSYYCLMCSGWHVTSSYSTEYAEILDKRDQFVLDSISKAKENVELFKKEKNKQSKESKKPVVGRQPSGAYAEFQERNHLVINRIINLDIAGAEIVINEMEVFLNDIAIDPVWKDKYENCVKQHKIAKRNVENMHRFISLSYKEQCYECKIQMTGDKILKSAFLNYMYVNRIEKELLDLENTLYSISTDEFEKKYIHIHFLITGIKSACALRKNYMHILNSIKQKYDKNNKEQSYKNLVMELITMVEDIRVAYENKEEKTAWSIIKKARSIQYGHKSDENISIINQYLDSYEDALLNYSVV